jgi:DNA-binding NarL/FixJ family response regulator
VIRVLIADDEPLIRAGIRTVLQSTKDIAVVAETDNGGDVAGTAIDHAVDVVLVDIRMPVLDGLGALEQLAARASQIRVVVLTSFSEEPNVLRALRGGAAGFVLKNCSADELITAVRAAHAGDAYLSPTVTRLVLRHVVPEPVAARDHAEARLATLTDRERAVLDLVAEGMSNADIGRSLHMSEATIKTYVSRVLSKLECTNRVQAALLVRDAGRGPHRTDD